MSPADLALLQPALEQVEFSKRKRLEQSGRAIEHIYFPLSGFASVIANAKTDSSIEVGLIGREGLTGLGVVMGTERASNLTFVQYAGEALRIRATDLRAVIAQSHTIHQALLRYAHVFMLQAVYTALANGRSKIEERLARWLLMAQDRVGESRLDLTHEFLAQMLSVRRPGVTIALSRLERSGLIEAERGAITILDREGLRELCKEAYGAAEAEYERLFGQ
jgi:CRP-like cAMP-binding protein